MSTSPSKYAENQFDSATVNSLSLMSELIDSTLPRITAAALLHPALAPAQAAIAAVATSWSAGETLAVNTFAAQVGATFAFTDRLDSLTRKPDADTNSPLETWDTTIRGAVAYNGPTYKELLPHGRDTLTIGTTEDRLDALRDFGVRLSQQTAKPALVALGVTVTSWSDSARALRTSQTTKMTAADNAQNAMEPLRVAAAAALYGMVGLGMSVFQGDPAQVDTLFDINVLRSPVQPVPAAPATTVWNPTARTLSTGALPESATRLEAWRLGEGGANELIALGTREETSVTIPATITFQPGQTYQLWLQARNATGSSTPSPVQVWTA
ncbi:MAG: hypothetical protein ABIT76_04790 [Chthoniobacterales bacterium]